jgi:hypothetical protein
MGSYRVHPFLFVLRLIQMLHVAGLQPLYLLSIVHCKGIPQCSFIHLPVDVQAVSRFWLLGKSYSNLLIVLPSVLIWFLAAESAHDIWWQGLFKTWVWSGNMPAYNSLALSHLTQTSDPKVLRLASPVTRSFTRTLVCLLLFLPLYGHYTHMFLPLCLRTRCSLHPAHFFSLQLRASFSSHSHPSQI